MEVSFDGTDFNGWQSQPHENTVQQTIERRLSGLFAGADVKIQGSGRTDAGVHAIAMGVTFSTPSEPLVPEGRIAKALNKMLPNSVKVANLREVPDEFHARFSARGKAYAYVVNRDRPSPFLARYAWDWPPCRDLAAIRRASRFLEGTHDFSAFATKMKDVENPVRTIHRVEACESDDLLLLTFVGDGFLYKMVRGMVGVLVKIGSGRLQPERVAELLELKNRGEGEQTAPAHGLFLMKVFYDDDSMSDFSLKTPPFHVS